MRTVPASVVVVTAAHVAPETNTSVPMGIAVSSFSTVTLDPPTVSFNIKQPSKTLSAIRDASGSFRVHFLASDSAGLQIVEHFCKGNHPDAYEERLKKLHVTFPQAATAMAPQILGSGVRAAFECTLTHELPVADHVILVAQIKSAELDHSRAPTMAYVNGSYQRLDQGGLIERHESEQKLEPPAAEEPAAKPQHESLADRNALSRSPLSFDHDQECEIAFDWLGIPGVEERSEFADRVRSYLKGIRGIRFANQADVKRQIRRGLSDVAAQLGVDLVALIQECQRGSSNAQVLPEFYWRLSTSKMAMLQDRMKQLVKADERFLKVPFQDLLQYLDVCVSYTDILPSDLLDPLREEGLIPPYKPSASLLSTDMIDGNVFIMEQVEHKLYRQARKRKRSPRVHLSFRDIADEAGVPTGVMYLFARTRIFTVEPYAPRGATFDITGDVSTEEGLVVIRRIAEYMLLNRPKGRISAFDINEALILRDINVDPLITGVSTSFVVSKIRHLANKPGPLKHRIEEWLAPCFARTVKWSDLNSRIADFVRKLPLRAISWKRRDILAAMGLSESTLIDSQDTEKPKSIAESKVLDMLVAKALKDHHGKGRDEENKAVAKFLMDKYKFDVTATAQISPEEA